MPATDYLRYDILDLDQIAVLSIIISFQKYNVHVGKIETIGAGVEKVKISANPDKFITKLFLAI